MTEKHWARVYYALIAFMFISLNIALISLILQKPKPALGDRGMLTMALVVIDVVALARAWAIWYHARRSTSSPAPRNPVVPLPNPDGGAVKDRGDPSLGFAFFAFAFFLAGAFMIGDCIITFADPRNHTFPAGFRWGLIPGGTMFFLFALVMLFFIVRFIVRTIWKRWKAKWQRRQK